MSKYRIGTGSSAKAKLQTSFGVPVVADTLINMTSESISSNYEYAEEGNLLASKTATDRDLSSITVEGSISTILRPEFADWLFKASLGNGDGEYHLVGANDDLPSSTVVIDRGGIAKKYSDLVVRSLTISADAGDYVKADVDFVGVREDDATPSDVTGATSFTLPSYRCTRARLLYGEEDADLQITDDIWDSCPLNGKLDVESCSLTIDNGVEASPRTYCSGVYANQPLHGKRSVTVSFNLPYSTEVEDFRKDYYANEDAPCLSLLLCFTSADKDENVTIYMPYVHITNAGANVGGEGVIDSSVEGECLSKNDAEPISVLVSHKG